VLSPAVPAAVISDRFWERRFGRDPSAIGKTLVARDRTFAIVGVTPRAFTGAGFERTPDLFLPLLPMMPDQQRREADLNSVLVLGRLKPGATVDQANAENQVLYRSFVASQAAAAPEKDRPAILRQRAAVLSSPDGFNSLRDDYRRSLLILMGIVTLVLLLACVNLSGLLLARAAARQREISIRLAIGAGRGRLIRQLLAESLVLATIGGLLGLAAGFWFSGRLFVLFANGREVTLPVAPDGRVLAFTAVIAVAACALSSLAPALQALRVNVNPTLKAVRASRHGALGKTLVVAQLAISMIVIVGATLFIGTLIRLNAVDRGFESDGVLVVNVRARRPYPPARVRAVQRALLDRLRMLPAVRSASATQMLPLAGGLWDRRIRVDGYTFRPDEMDVVGFNAVAPGYFGTLGTPLASGREFDDRDLETSRRVAIVNESFARRFFAGRSPLGGRVTSANVTYEIVGVVRDAKYENLRSAVIDTLYIPWTQRDDDQPTRYNYLVRVAGGGDPMQLASGLDRAVRDADPALRVRTAQTYASIIDRSIISERLMAALGGLFGVLALLVAALGMFGLLAFQVAQRTSEIGIRIALGATRVTMMRSVLTDVAVVTGAGIAIGCVGALLLTGLARSFLFGLTPTDPAVFLVAGSALAIAAVVAGWLPARRASRVDPLVALRHE
jgi:predicted permease